jgi:predicted anti-sigma-YlaC factor YlaD
MRCDSARLSLGAYVLEGLDAEDRAAVEVHLAECSTCRAELTELGALPGLLGLLSLEEVESGSPSPSADGYERLLARAEAQPTLPSSRWTSRRVGLAAAAAAVIVFAGAGFVLNRGGATSGVHTYAASAGPVHMDVALTDEVGGTGLDVSVRGVTANQRCSLVAVTREGSRKTVSTWQVTYTGKAWSKAAMPIRQSELAQLLLLGDDGNTLVKLDL